MNDTDDAEEYPAVLLLKRYSHLHQTLLKLPGKNGFDFR